MSKNIFLSYAGRTVKAPFAGSSKEDLASCFASQFPHSSSQFVYYIADPATGVQYEVSDVADITEGAQVAVKLCDESGGAPRATQPNPAGRRAQSGTHNSSQLPTLTHKAVFAATFMSPAGDLNRTNADAAVAAAVRALLHYI